MIDADSQRHVRFASDRAANQGREGIGQLQTNVMSFQPKVLRCVECGDEFVWTAGEQEFYSRNNLRNQPKRCKPCRARRQQERYAPRNRERRR